MSTNFAKTEIPSSSGHDNNLIVRGEHPYYSDKTNTYTWLPQYNKFNPVDTSFQGNSNISFSTINWNGSVYYCDATVSLLSGFEFHWRYNTTYLTRTAAQFILNTSNFKDNVNTIELVVGSGNSWSDSTPIDRCHYFDPFSSSSGTQGPSAHLYYKFVATGTFTIIVTMTNGLIQKDVTVNFTVQ